MSNGPDLEARVTALETKMVQVAADAAAARHLAAANDRDFSELCVKVDAHRAAINALGIQTAARFDRIDERFDRMDERINGLESEMRVGFTDLGDQLGQANAGLAQIVRLLTDESSADQ